MALPTSQAVLPSSWGSPCLEIGPYIVRARAGPYFTDMSQSVSTDGHSDVHLQHEQTRAIQARALALAFIMLRSLEARADGSW